jgi:lysophospholipase L1-like esterase
MRIVFVGASLTEGVYGGSYVNEVQRLLPDHEIINRGVGGSTINRMVDQLESVLALEPDAVFVLAGSNDAIAYSQPETRSYYEKSQHVQGGYLTPEQFGVMFREVITHIQLAHAIPLVGLPPLEYNPDVVAAAHLFNDESRQIAESLNVPVLDLQHMIPDEVPDRPALDLKHIFLIGDRVQKRWKDYTSEQTAGGYSYSFDGIHFTPEAAAEVGVRVAAFLTEHLRL